MVIVVFQSPFLRPMLLWIVKAVWLSKQERNKFQHFLLSSFHDEIVCGMSCCRPKLHHPHHRPPPLLGFVPCILEMYCVVFREQRFHVHLWPARTKSPRKFLNSKLQEKTRRNPQSVCPLRFVPLSAALVSHKSLSPFNWASKGSFKKISLEDCGWGAPGMSSHMLFLPP